MNPRGAWTFQRRRYAGWYDPSDGKKRIKLFGSEPEARSVAAKFAAIKTADLVQGKSETPALILSISGGVFWLLQPAAINVSRPGVPIINPELFKVIDCVVHVLNVFAKMIFDLLVVVFHDLLGEIRSFKVTLAEVK